MSHATFVGVPDGPVIALAALLLTRAKLTLPCTTRQQAINILRSVRPAPSKATPHNIKATPSVNELCQRCGKPIPWGTPCKICFNGEVPEHISCKPEKHGAALRKLFLAATRQLTGRK